MDIYHRDNYANLNVIDGPHWIFVCILKVAKSGIFILVQSSKKSIKINVQMGKVGNIFSALSWRVDQIVHTIWDLVAFTLKKNIWPTLWDMILS